MPSLASVNFAMALLVASANGHQGENTLDCNSLSSAFRAGTARHLPKRVRDQVHELVRQADTDLIQQAWVAARGQGESLRKLTREARGEAKMDKRANSRRTTRGSMVEQEPKTTRRRKVAG